VQHHNAQHGQQRSGWGIVWVDGRKDGYEGAVIDNGVSVYIDGRPRVVDGPHSAPRVTYRARTRRQWPARRVEIHWLDEEAA